jgi:hypothetical protein
MPAITKTKGDLGQAMVMADALKRGYKVALPLGEDWRYDLIVQKGKTLLRVQCKYVESTSGVIKVRCETHDGRSYYRYKPEDLDYIAVYDKITDACYYVNSSFLGKDGRGSLNLRIKETKNKQKKKVFNARDFIEF